MRARAGSGAAIDPDGPLALPSSLPVDAIVAALRAEEIPAAVSRDAGGYLCNHIFYVLMGALAAGARGRLRPCAAARRHSRSSARFEAARTIVAVASTSKYNPYT